MTQFDELIAAYKTACRKLPCVDARAAESSALKALKDYVAELEARRDQDLTLIADGFELASQIQALKAREVELVGAKIFETRWVETMKQFGLPDRFLETYAEMKMKVRKLESGKWTCACGRNHQVGRCTNCHGEWPDGVKHLDPASSGGQES